MKPIEPGALVMIVNAMPCMHFLVGKCFVVTGPQEPVDDVFLPCVFCGGDTWWPLSDDAAACGCVLIRIDDNPDAVTEPEQREVEA